MNVYLKNYAIWLGGSQVFLLILGYLRLLPYGFAEILGWLFIIGGAVVGTIMTHKELKKNIEFGKAVGPVLLMIGGFAFLSFLLYVINWGTEYLSYFLMDFIIITLVKCLIGISVLLATGGWYMFEKAGKPGWGFIVPIYNLILMCEIGKKPTWWVAMLLIPIANIVFMIMIFDGISKAFGKESGFTVGLVFLRQIFFAILGYGDAQYLGEKTAAANENVIDDL